MHENADNLRNQLRMKAEDIDYLVDVWIKWHHAMKNRKYWAGRNREQYLAAREEENQLSNIIAQYPDDIRMFVQELAIDRITYLEQGHW